MTGKGAFKYRMTIPLDKPQYRRFGFLKQQQAMKQGKFPQSGECPIQGVSQFYEEVYKIEEELFRNCERLLKEGKPVPDYLDGAICKLRRMREKIMEMMMA